MENIIFISGMHVVVFFGTFTLQLTVKSLTWWKGLQESNLLIYRYSDFLVFKIDYESEGFIFLQYLWLRSK